jgi:hypothetical protein
LKYVAPSNSSLIGCLFTKPEELFKEFRYIMDSNNHQFIGYCFCLSNRIGRQIANQHNLHKNNQRRQRKRN